MPKSDGSDDDDSDAVFCRLVGSWMLGWLVGAVDKTLVRCSQLLLLTPTTTGVGVDKTGVR